MYTSFRSSSNCVDGIEADPVHFQHKQTAVRVGDDMALIDSISVNELNGVENDDLPPSPCRDDPQNPSLRSGDVEENNADENDEDESNCRSPKSRNLKQLYRLSELELKNTVGTGTFGRVLLSRHRPTKKHFALKVLPITEIIRLKQVEHVRNEKNILLNVKHPFIVNLYWTDHCDRFLYMLFEYVCGGELFTYLRNAGRFETSTGLFYASEIVFAIEYLHSCSIVYRDLSPENLLLDKDGHLKICDFGFAKKIDERNSTWTLCGTPEYLAPEIIQSKGYNKAVDWWALGVFVYEMLVGYPPFFDENAFGIYQKIMSGKIDWPKHLDPLARDMIKRLLVQDRTKRLGNMKNGAADVKNHRWFHSVNWDDVQNRRLEPPIVPICSHEGDTRNFDAYPEIDLKSLPMASDADLDLFDDF